MSDAVAFVVTWVLLALVVGWFVGGAAKLGGKDERGDDRD